jgi:hypothetical protein
MRFAALAWTLFALAAVLAASAWLPAGRRKGWGHPALFAAAALAAIVGFRWPLLLDNQQLLDPDESQLMSGAITLGHEPAYWRSVDGQTRGPVDDLPLLALQSIGIRVDYTAARFLSVVLAWLCFLALWACLRQAFPDSLARLLSLPFLAVHAFSDFWNFVQYDSEHVPNALVAGAVLLVVLAGSAESAGCRRAPRLFLAGALLGAVPFAKVQFLPVAAWVGAFAAFQAVFQGGTARTRRTSDAAALVFGLWVVPVIMLSAILLQGTWREFIDSYIVDNLQYARDRIFPWSQSPARLLELCRGASGSLPFLAGVALPSALALFLVRWRSSQRRRLTLFALGLAAVSAYAVLAPGRMFFHYVQLLLFPLALLSSVLVGALVVEAAAKPGHGRVVAGILLFAFLGCSLIPQIAWRIREAQPSLGQFSVARGALRQTAVSAEIARHARPGEAVGIWGWEPKFWVLTGTLQATRDGNTNRQISEHDSKERYRQRYLRDLEQSMPPVFVDAVGEGNFLYHDRGLYGHEIFPELDAFIRTNYRQLADLEGSRIYLRRDALGRDPY